MNNINKIYLFQRGVKDIFRVRYMSLCHWNRNAYNIPYLSYYSIYKL